jgi:hypothetical protein
MFAIQVQACVKYGGITKPEEQVIWVSALLRDKPAEWFEAYLEDYFGNKEEARKTRTNEMFKGGIRKFVTEMQKLYGYEDETRKVLKELRSLKQRGSVADYTAEFWRLSNKLERNEETMWSDYYFGLKDFIKDAITEREEGDPNTLQELIEFAENLDKRTWQRKMEKSQGHGFHTKRYEKNTRSNRTIRDEDAMDWEANAATKPYANRRTPPTGGKRGRGKDRGRGPPRQGNKRAPLTEEQKKRFKDGECLKCGKKGHYARECRGSGKQANIAEKQPKAVYTPIQGNTSLNEKNEELDMYDTRHPEHARLSWTGCYDDNCYVHKSDKDGSGWYPKRPKASKGKALKQVNMHKALIPIERDPRLISVDDEKFIIETWHWKQVKTEDDAEEHDTTIGWITHDPQGKRKTEPLWVVFDSTREALTQYGLPPPRESSESEEGKPGPSIGSEIPDCLMGHRHSMFWCKEECKPYLEAGRQQLKEAREELHEEIPEDEREEYSSSEDEVTRMINEHTEYIEELSKKIDTRANIASGMEPRTATIQWTDKDIVIRTDQWTCLRCQNKTKNNSCTCYAKDWVIYNPKIPHGQLMMVIHTRVHQYAAQQLDRNQEIIATYPLKELIELPHIGTERRGLPMAIDDSSSEEEDEVKAAMTTTIIAWHEDRIVVRTCEWFVDWCKDPSCKQAAQHRHRYFNPNGQKKGEYADCVWRICHSKDCTRPPRAHAHQTCMVPQKQTLPMSYFGRLPRQDSPQVVRAKGLDAINEARQDAQEATKNDEAATGKDDL